MFSHLVLSGRYSTESQSPLHIQDRHHIMAARVIWLQHLRSWPSWHNYLFIVLSEERSTWRLVDGLSNSNDLSIAVANRHAQQWLGFVACQLVDFIAEPTILQSTGDNCQLGHSVSTCLLQKCSVPHLFCFQMTMRLKLATNQDSETMVHSSIAQVEPFWQTCDLYNILWRCEASESWINVIHSVGVLWQSRGRTLDFLTAKRIRQGTGTSEQTGVLEISDIVAHESPLCTSQLDWCRCGSKEITG